MRWIDSCNRQSYKGPGNGLLDIAGDFLFYPIVSFYFFQSALFKILPSARSLPSIRILMFFLKAKIPTGTPFLLKFFLNNAHKLMAKRF